MADLDFPAAPVLYQIWTAPTGTVYVWNGTGWVIGFYDSETSQFDTIGGIFDQIRTLLQDVDASSGGYRYSDDSLMMNFNQGLLEMYRIRPDIFLANSFVVPQYNVSQMSSPLSIEPQVVPSLIYYVVGLTQVRDDEQNQDARALAFLKIFQQTLIVGSLV